MVTGVPTDEQFGRSALVERIRAEILSSGPITFERFMAFALYEPDLGYYAARWDVPESSPPDFQTSPQLHPAFGNLLAGELLRIWEALGCPAPFVVAEPGAGDGTLARQILGGLAERHPDLLVEYHAADARLTRSAPIDLLRASLTYWPDLNRMVGGAVKAHAVVSNEFFDALPVHRVLWSGGSLREVFVGWSDRGFVELIGAATAAALGAHALAGRPAPPDGWRGEVCTVLPSVVHAIAGLVERGVVLTIDYGYGDDPADEQTAGDSLVGYDRHRWTGDIYRRVGQQDLTSHVDYRALLRIGQTTGLEPAGSLSQRDFLLDRGLSASADRLADREQTPGKRWQSRFAAAELVKDDGLGKFRIVAQQKGAHAYRLRLISHRPAITDR